jgi:NADP-dependent 3-hydroxy acid dehydrogenase YdfG
LCPGVCKSELLLSNDKERIDEYREWLKTLKGEILNEKDVSDCVLFAYSLPQHACIRDITICPTTQIE